MSKIIVFSGDSDNIFFLNEIEHLKKIFSEIIVVSYSGDVTKTKNMLNDHKFKIYSADSSFKNVFSIRFFVWLFSYSTIKEIFGVLSFSRLIFKKIGYIIFYGLFYTSVLSKLRLELKNSNNVILYSMWLSRGSYSCSKLKLKFNKNVKLAFSRAHAYDLYENRNQLNYLPFRTYINSNLDVIHFISEDGMKYHIKKYGKISSDRRISRLGTINKKNIIKKIIRKNYISIASCSSITDIKRLDLIIDILSSLKIKFKWIHIGDGCKKCEIINYAKKKLSDKDFEFLGQVDNSLILNKYYDYDVDYFINLSDSEGIPVSIMEVFSMGIPTIARNVGGISEIVNNLNGLVLSEKFDLEKYSKIINSEIENRLFNEDIYLSKSKKALQTWEKLYNAEENYDKFFNINEE